MKKISIVVIIILLLFIEATNCFASIENSPAMVYASGDELEYVYNALLSDQQISAMMETYERSIMKETITRVYCLDPVNYAKTGEMVIEPLFADEEKTEPVYIAKIIDRDNNYDGNIRFSVVNGIAHHLVSSAAAKDRDVGSLEASCSYADHAERIRKCLGKDEFIPATDVIYVIVDFIGQFFYIKNNNDQFICVGNVPKDNSSVSAGKTDYIIDAATVKELSDKIIHRMEQLKAEQEKWESEHPGEIYEVPDGGFGGQCISSQCSELNDIKDISNYLNIDFSVNRGMPDYVKLPGEQPAHSNGIMAVITASGAVLTVVAVALITFAVKKKKTNNV